MKKCLSLFLFAILLVACSSPAVTSSSIPPTLTATLLPPTETQIPTATSTPTETPDPNMPADATGKDAKGDWIKTVTENGRTITEFWAGADELGPYLEKGVNGHWFNSLMPLDLSGNPQSIYLLDPTELVYSDLTWTGISFYSIPLTVFSEDTISTLNTMTLTHQDVGSIGVNEKLMTFSTEFFGLAAIRYFNDYPEKKSVTQPYKTIYDIPYTDMKTFLINIQNKQATINVIQPVDINTLINLNDSSTYQTTQWRLDKGVDVYFVDSGLLKNVPTSNGIKSASMVVDGKLRVLSSTDSFNNASDHIIRYMILRAFPLIT